MDICHVVLLVTENVFSTQVTRADELSRWAGGKHVFAAFVMDFNEQINRRSKQSSQFLRDFHGETRSGFSRVALRGQTDVFFRWRTRGIVQLR